MRPERRPPLGFDPAAAEAHLLDRGLEVVVADMPEWDPAQHRERLDVALHKGFLAL